VTHQRVLDVMRADAVTVTTRTPFKDLVGLMVGKGMDAVPVLGRHGEVVGVVTETDLLKKQSLQQDPAAPRPIRRAYRARWSRACGDCAGEVMTTHPVTVRPGATVAETARLMDRYHCGCLSVVDEAGKLAGTVTSRDLLRVFLRPDDEIRDEIMKEILAGGFAANPDQLTVDVADGVVTVSGEIERKSMLPLVLPMIRAVDGVVDAEGQLSYTVDDTRPPVGP
jgi:CBS domain-containing protein